MANEHAEILRRSNSRRIRSIFISDVHLGCKHARADALAAFLDEHEPDYLYLVGDIIDGWKLQSGWRWTPEYSRMMQRCIELAEQGTQLCYTPGNHDAFLRQFLYDFGVVRVADEFIHTTADGQRLLVIHGDRFDRFEKSAQWFSFLASFAYDALLSANRLASKWRKKSKRSAYAFSASVKLRVKQLVMFLSDFEQRLIAHAAEQRCSGVVCGHIHKPAISEKHAVAYFNTGDWVEHCTALVEYVDGSMELLFFSPEVEDGHIEVVDRIAGPRKPIDRKRNDDWHDEFDDGFTSRESDDWSSPLEDEPAISGGVAVIVPTKPKNRIRRFAQKLRGWPKAVATRLIARPLVLDATN